MSPRIPNWSNCLRLPLCWGGESVDWINFPLFPNSTPGHMKGDAEVILVFSILPAHPERPRRPVILYSVRGVTGERSDEILQLRLVSVHQHKQLRVLLRRPWGIILRGRVKNNPLVTIVGGCPRSPRRALGYETCDLWGALVQRGETAGHQLHFSRNALKSRADYPVSQLPLLLRWTMAVHFDDFMWKSRGKYNSPSDSRLLLDLHQI
jgi:hypothetical protein